MDRDGAVAGGGGEPAIRVPDLRKTFRVPEREAGLRASVRPPRH